VRLKRLLDIGLALLLGLSFLPVLAITALLVFASLGRPILFKQVRAGINGREFTLLKWRSMTDARDARGELLPDPDRMTLVGRLIRRIRIDELPSIINILRGDLSFVGPRPLPSGNPINLAYNGARLACRPGLTGLAQVSGNTLLSDREKLAVDLHYIRTCTIRNDIAIVWRTVLTVIRGERRDEALIQQAVRDMENIS